MSININVVFIFSAAVTVIIIVAVFVLITSFNYFEVVLSRLPRQTFITCLKQLLQNLKQHHCICKASEGALLAYLEVFFTECLLTSEG